MAASNITILGLSLPTLVAGAIFSDVVALNVDYEVLLGFAVIATLAAILGSLLADVSCALLDPRVRYG